MTAKDVLVEVTIDHQPVSCRVRLTGFAWDGYWDMAEDEPVPEDFFVRLDVYYSLPKGYDVDRINVTMECDGGQYDGTGSISNDAEGNIEAWSRAFYGEEPIAPETQPSQNETQPTTEPQTTPIVTTPVTHVHSWVEQNGTVDVLAPGEDIWLASRNGVTYGTRGTSYATGFVSAAAALLWQENLSLTPQEITQTILSTAQKAGDYLILNTDKQ